MQNRHRIFWAVALALVLTGATLLTWRWVLARALPMQARTLIRGRPYTIMLITLVPGKDGRRHVTEQRTVAVNRDGAEVWIGFHPQNPTVGAMRRIVRPDGRATLALERFSLRLTQQIEVHVADAVPRMGAGACRAAYEADAGDMVVAGVAVQGAVHEQARSLRTWRWDAPEYGCLTLAVKHEKWNGRQWALLAEQRAVWFRPGDPEPQLFDEAWFARMKETSPAQWIRRIAEATGARPEDCPACYNPASVEEWERQYWRQQPQQR